MNNQRDIQLHKEIKDYKESIFFGLSMRQSFFSAIAAIVAVIVYFCLKPHFGTETLSWMCILAAMPFAALGFVNYHTLMQNSCFGYGLKVKYWKKVSQYLNPQQLIMSILKILS